MRLDKFIVSATEMTRTMAQRALVQGRIKCDGHVVKNRSFNVTETTHVTLNDQLIELLGTRYIMINKPTGYICSNKDEVHPSVLNLVKIPRNLELIIAGRLDTDTTGLVLATSDGKWSHKITSPRRECHKCYRVQLITPMSDEAIEQLRNGVQLRAEKNLTRPAVVDRVSEQEILLTIQEGKYHQVKRMCAAVDNKVVGLHREKIGSIELDPSLAPGEWRVLTQAEIQSI